MIVHQVKGGLLKFYLLRTSVGGRIFTVYEVLTTRSLTTCRRIPPVVFGEAFGRCYGQITFVLWIDFTFYRHLINLRNIRYLKLFDDSLGLFRSYWHFENKFLLLIWRCLGYIILCHNIPFLFCCILWF